MQPILYTLPPRRDPETHAEIEHRIISKRIARARHDERKRFGKAAGLRRWLTRG